MTMPGWFEGIGKQGFGDLRLHIEDVLKSIRASAPGGCCGSLSAAEGTAIRFSMFGRQGPAWLTGRAP